MTGSYFDPISYKERRRVEIQHIYVSTACQHERHTECRLHCKFCATPCVCVCHQAGLY